MAKIKLRFTLAAKILIITLLIVVISNTLLSVISFRMSSKNIKEGVYNQLDEISKSIASQITSVNEKEFSILNTLAASDAMKNPSLSLEYKQEQLNRIAVELRKNYKYLAFYDKNGNCINEDGEIENHANDQYFISAIKGRNNFTDPEIDEETNLYTQFYASPVFLTEEETIGVIAAEINQNVFFDIIKNFDLGYNMHPVVANRTSKKVIACGDEFSGMEEHIFNESRGDLITSIYRTNPCVVEYYDNLLMCDAIGFHNIIPKSTLVVFGATPTEVFYSSLNTYKRMAIIFLIGAILSSIVLITIAIEVSLKPLKVVKKTINEIAQGNADLTQRIPETTKDEVGDVVKGFNGFVEKLQDIMKNLLDSKDNLLNIDSSLQLSTQEASSSITQIIANIESVNGHILSQAASVTETAGAVNEITANIESLEKMIENQANGVAQASSAVEQMIGNIESVNNGVTKMVSSFNQLEEKAKYGIETQLDTYNQINIIKDQSIMLQEANTAIASIAEQTNLLAMNAAIEAAHAGEAGKGFSVVADEIRKLSETSSEQSNTITAELTKIQETIQKVVEFSNTTNTAFSSVSASIADTSQIIEQIKGAMIEQQTGSRQIIQALQDMNNSTSEVRVASSEMTNGSKQILTEIEKLQNATNMIRSSVDEMHTGAERINETGASLSTISAQVSDSINQIGDEIGLFKV